VKSVDTIGYYQHIATLYAHYSHKELQKGRGKSTEKARQPNVLPQPHDKHRINTSLDRHQNRSVIPLGKANIYAA